MTAFVDADLAELGRSALQLGLSALIQSTLLIVAGLLGARALRRRGPALQSAIYRATLASVALTMLLSICSPGSFTPLWRIALPPAPETALSGGAGKAPEPPLRLARTNPAEDASRGSAATPRMKLSYPPPSRPLPEPATRPGRTERTAHLQSAGPLAGLYLGAVGLWGAVALMLLAWLALCYFYILRLRARSAPVREGDATETLRELCAAHSTRAPALLAGSGVRSPFLTGLWRPAILLPASYAADFDEDAMRAILAHELMHMTRRDCAWNLLGRLTCAAAWMQPLLWLLCRRMEQASEEVCDQAVIQHHCPPRAYATCLLDLAERFLPRPPERALGSGVVPDRSSLARRIQQILAGPRARTLALSRRSRAMVASGALAAAVGGSLLISGAVEVPVVATPASAVKSTEGPVSGRVLTPDGKPVKGAPVFWISLVGRERRAHASVKTDDAGRFRFANAAQLRQKGNDPQLLVLAEGWGLTYRNLPPNQNTLDLSLEPATTVRVPFVNSDGKPTAELPVSVEWLFGKGSSFCVLPKELANHFAARTDGTGIATIAGLPQGYRLLLEVGDAGLAQLAIEDQIDLSASPVTEAKPIRLLPAASIRGRVTYGPSGKPAAGILVGAQGIDGSQGWGEGVTDNEGRYHLRQLRTGTYNVALGLEDELASSWTAPAHERLVIGRGEQLSGIDFTLIHGAILTGTATAADNGVPIPGIAVSVYGPAHPRTSAWSQGMKTGTDGRYLLHVPAGEQHLFLAITSPIGFGLPARKEVDLTVKDGETVTFDFRLPRSRLAKPVHGRVLGPDGTPVAGAEVVVSSSDHSRPGATLHRTDAGGAFTLGADLVAHPVTLRARHSGMATVQATAATGGDEVTLRLQKDGFVTLSGHVTDVAGRPIAGAEVTAFEWVYEWGSEIAKTATDEQGRYAVSSLWPDAHYMVSATAKGYGSKNMMSIDGLKPGETRALEPLTLRKADRSVAGRVVDASGKPVAGVTLWIEGRESTNQSVTTDREGRFRRDGLVDETIRLQCDSPDKKYWAQKKVPAGSMDVLLVLPPEAGKDTFSIDDQLTERFAALQGRQAPPLRVVAWVNSAPRTLQQLRGKVVLIDFWGMGCGPCVASLPEVQRTAERFAQKGVVVIGLHDASASAPQLREFAYRHKLTYPLAIDAPANPKGSARNTFGDYGVQGIPSAAVIDRDGNVAYLGSSLVEAVGAMGGLLERSAASRR
jgi:peroxiredoxin/5-hydroxyisourate hydrolase-like protein (transthyretin family)